MDEIKDAEVVETPAPVEEVPAPVEEPVRTGGETTEELEAVEAGVRPLKRDGEMVKDGAVVHDTAQDGVNSNTQ